MNDKKNGRTNPVWIFIIIVAIVCLFSLISSTCSFVYNQLVFNKAYSNAAAEIVNQLTNVSDNPSSELSINTTESKQAMAQVVIEHLKQLQELQKNAASNDVMSFLYSILSTILVGVCAGFVIKSNDSARRAEASANESKKAENEIHTFAQRLKNAENQKAVLEVTAVRMDILNTREEIHFSIHVHSNIRLNECFNVIKKGVHNLSYKNIPKYIKQLQTELLLLNTEVGRYRGEVEKLTQVEKKDSFLTAIGWYEKLLKEAVEHCDVLLEIRS